MQYHKLFALCGLHLVSCPLEVQDIVSFLDLPAHTLEKSSSCYVPGMLLVVKDADRHESVPRTWNDAGGFAVESWPTYKAT